MKISFDYLLMNNKVLPGEGFLLSKTVLNELL